MTRHPETAARDAANRSDRPGSAVGVAAVPNTQDIDPVPVVVEANSLIANPKPELGRVDAAKRLDIASASGRKTLDRGHHTQRHGVIERS